MISAEQREGQNFIIVGDKHSADDWGLIVPSTWVLESPQVKTNYLSIPAVHGDVDLTEVLAGEPRYHNRNLRWEFIFTNANEDWDGLRANILNFCHGRRMKIFLPGYDDRYLTGRITCGNLQYQRGGNWARLPMSAFCDPFFNLDFEKTFEFEDTYETIIYGGTSTVTPEIVTNQAVEVIINGVSVYIPEAGTWRLPALVIRDGANEVVLRNAYFGVQRASGWDSLYQFTRRIWHEEVEITFTLPTWALSGPDYFSRNIMTLTPSVAGTRRDYLSVSGNGGVTMLNQNGTGANNRVVRNITMWDMGTASNIVRPGRVFKATNLALSPTQITSDTPVMTLETVTTGRDFLPGATNNPQTPMTRVTRYFGDFGIAVANGWGNAVTLNNLQYVLFDFKHTVNGVLQSHIIAVRSDDVRLPPSHRTGFHGYYDTVREIFVSNANVGLFFERRAHVTIRFQEGSL